MRSSILGEKSCTIETESRGNGEGFSEALPYYSPLLCPYGNQCSNRRRESLDRAAAMFSELPHPSLPLSGDLSILFLMFMFPTYASPHIDHS
jgi:hypothetical protein